MLGDGKSFPELPPTPRQFSISRRSRHNDNSRRSAPSSANAASHPPMALLVTIFLLVLVSQTISWIGSSVLQEFFCSLYLRLFHSKLIARQHELKTTTWSTKAQLMATSAQDHFAKWAKLKRSVDKGFQDLEATNSQIASAKTQFSMKFSSALWFMTTGLQFFIGWWYRKSAVFYLPQGWFGPLTWWLGLPWAPAGSVSCGVWQMACRRIILVMERTAKDLWVRSEAPQPPPAKEKAD